MRLQAGSGLTVDIADDGTVRVGRDEADWFGPGSPTRPATVQAPVQVLDDLGPATSVTVVDGDMRCSVRAYAERPMVVFRSEALVRRRPASRRARSTSRRSAWPIFTPAERAAGRHPEGLRALVVPALRVRRSRATPARPRRLVPAPPPSAHRLAAPAHPGRRPDAAGRTARRVPRADHRPQRRHPALRLARRPRIGARRLHHRPGRARRPTAPATPRRAGAGCCSTPRAPCARVAGPTRSVRALRTGPTTVRPTGTGPSRATTWRARSSPPSTTCGRMSVPIGAVQLDSWFYPHAELRPFDTDEWVVPPSAMTAWEERADVLPDGIAALRERLGDPPLVAHIRHLSADAPIAAETPDVGRRRLRRPGHPRGLRAVARPVPRLGRRDVRARLARRGVLRRARPAGRAGPGHGLAGGHRRRRPRAGHHPPVVHGHAGRLRPDHDPHAGDVGADQRRPRLHRHRRPAVGVVLHHQRAGPQPRADAVQGRVPRRPRGGRRQRRARGAAVRPLDRAGRPRRPGRAHRPGAGAADLPGRRAPHQAAHRRSPPPTSPLLSGPAFNTSCSWPSARPTIPPAAGRTWWRCTATRPTTRSTGWWPSTTSASASPTAT